MGKRRRVVVDKESLLKKMEYDFSRDAEWFKRTNKKIEEIKQELEKKFYSEDKRKQKVEFMLKLKGKVKDYEDAKKFEERYKKVRFVERRKLERKMKRVKKMLEECNGKDDEERKRLVKEEEEIEKDLNYVKFYPKTYKYYSLFPNKDKDKKEMVEKREMMRKKIEFYVNRKMKKKGGNDNNDNEVVDSDVDVEDEVDNMSDDNEVNNSNDSIEKDNTKSNMDKSNSDNNKQQKTNKKIIKDKNNKNNNTNNKSNNNNNNNNNITQTYESHPKHPKKQPFKDPFFELDE